MRRYSAFLIAIPLAALAALALGALAAGAAGNTNTHSPRPSSGTGDNTMTSQTQTAIFAAGCFWGVEENFRRMPGVIQTEVGYSGGHSDNPTYKEVCSDRTGHAEVVRVRFDPERISYRELVDFFWTIHDPTQVNRQGPDVGSQYRSAIFYLDAEQRQVAEKSRQALAESTRLGGRPVATEITEAGSFYRAEEYHQQYLAKRGIAQCH